jgi:hypothetical protein|tara:strand:+ start:1577 stop:3331 length:1755 start_codon:yes stop_codon:yes gene_type:complete
MSLINTTDTDSGSPNVPDAAKTAAWKDYIWIRRLGTSGEAKFYIWNEDASSDGTYLKWQEKSDVALDDIAIDSSKIVVGNASNKGAAVAMSGNATITNAGVVTVGSVANNAITNAMVNTSAAIAYSKLNLTGAILNADLAGSITAAKLAGSIPYSKLSIADDEIPFAKINGLNINNANMADMAANTVKVRDADSSGAPSDKAVGNTQILIGDGTGFTAASLSGDVTMANTGAVTIGSSAVHGSMLNVDVGDASSIELSSNTLSIKSAGVEVSHIKGHSSAGVLGYGSSGAAAAITADSSSSGKVLKSNGNNAAPTFQSETSSVPMVEIDHANHYSSHWVVPAGVTKIKVCLQGAGAGGGVILSNNGHGGGGGGGGAYVESEFNVSAGQVFMLKVGEGSVSAHPGSGNNFSSGGATEFIKLTGTSGGSLTTETKATAPGGVGASESSSGNGYHSIGGAGGTAPALTSPYNASGQYNYTKRVNGQNGGAQDTAFYGQNPGSVSGNGGFGGASYKGQGPLGGVVEIEQPDSTDTITVQDGVKQDHREKNILRGSGSGFGGAGVSISGSNRHSNRRGGDGWGAIYNIS